MAIKNVAIIGAGGNIGSPILAALNKAGFTVTIISRKSSKSTFTDNKVVQIADDYPHADLVAAFKGHEAVVSCLTGISDGKLNATFQERFIDAAIEAGVQRFIPSEYGNDNSIAAIVELCPIYADKLKVIDYLRAREDKITWTAVITGPFFDFGMLFGSFLIDAKKGQATLIDGGSNKFTTSTYGQVGEGVSAILKHDTDTVNRYVNIESFTTSQNEILAAFQKEGHKFEVKHQDGKDLAEGSKVGYQAGNVYAAFGLVQVANFSPGYGADASVEADKWRLVLGLAKQDLQTEMKRVLAGSSTGAQISAAS